MPLVPHVAAGQVVASTWGNLVADHVVMRFTTAAQRTSQLTAPIVGQLTTRDDAPGVVEYWTGTAWAPITPARELAYAQITASKSVTSTAEASADLVVAAPAVTFDGTTAAVIELFSPAIIPASAAGALVQLWLYQDGASIGRMAMIINPAAAQLALPGYAQRRITPTAGAHTYSFAATVSGGTGTVAASTGGLGQYQPAFIRITRAT